MDWLTDPRSRLAVPRRRFLTGGAALAAYAALPKDAEAWFPHGQAPAATIVPVDLGIPSTAWPGTTMTSTIGATTVAANDYIIVGVIQNSANDTSGAVTDTAGDTFTQAIAVSVGGFEAGIRVFYAKSAGLTTGNTIVYTSTGGTPFQGMNCMKVTGLALAAVLDGAGSTGNNAGAATSFPSGSVTPSFTGDLVYGIAYNHDQNAMVQSSGFATPPASPGFGSNIGTGGIAGTLIEPGTTAHNYAPTAVSSSGWSSAILLFKHG
jgi:hypothetical protein